MKICSVTMAGLDTSSREAIETARPISDAFIVRRPGEVTDFAAARNALLEQAAEEGFDWAIMLDTDERLVIDRRRWEDTTGDPREAMGVMLDAFSTLTPFADVLMTPHVSGSYAKERIFRLPARGHYEGPVHECFVLDPGARREDRVIEWIAFDEIPKTAAELRAKFERDDRILRDYINEHPKDPRWWYYRGDTRANMGDWPLALDCFQQCWALDGWDEESAWAMYRAAEIHANLGEYEWALGCCTQGMLRHPGIAELPWLAGWCCFKLGRYEHAIHWERMAIAHNDQRAEVSRVGFRHPPALFEGPWDVRRHALSALGKPNAHTEEEFRERLAERLEMEKFAAPE